MRTFDKELRYEFLVEFKRNLDITCAIIHDLFKMIMQVLERSLDQNITRLLVDLDFQVECCDVSEIVQ